MVAHLVSDEGIADHGYIRAHLLDLRTQEGGRRKPIHSGYRATWHFGEINPDGLMVMHDAPLAFDDAETIEPRGQTSARLYPLRLEYWESIVPGTSIAMHKGTRQVGEARVLERFDP